MTYEQLALDGGKAEMEESGERPNMDGDEMAEIDELAAEINSGMSGGDMAADVGADGDAPAGAGDAFQMGAGGEEITVGDMYARGLCVFANEVTRQFADGDDIPFETSSGDLDTTLPEQLGIPTYVNQIMAKREQDTMSPERALVVSTAMFALAVVATNPTLVSSIAEEVKSNNSDDNTEIEE